MRRLLIATTLLFATACASTPAPRREPQPPPRDRTSDPEFEAAVAAMEREFETQAAALASGVYEPFVHPDSILATRPSGGAGTVDPGSGDPSTAALLGTLPAAEPYNPPREDPRPPAAAQAAPAERSANWTLQAGAFGEETGAFVRLRQLATDFPGWPRWHSPEGGLFRVYVGRFVDRDEAERARAALAARGYGDAWIVAAP